MSKTSHKKHEAKQKKSKPKVIKSATIPEEDIFTEHKVGSEIIIALLIFGLGLFFMVPIYSSLTATGQLALMIIFLLAVLLFAGLHWRKKPLSSMTPTDDHVIAKFVYISALALLSIAIIIQFFSGGVDIWLIFILVLLVLLRVMVASFFRSQRK